MTEKKRGSVVLPVDIPGDVERQALQIMFDASPELEEAAEEIIVMLASKGVMGARPAVYALIIKTMAQIQLKMDAITLECESCGVDTPVMTLVKNGGMCDTCKPKPKEQT